MKVSKTEIIPIFKKWLKAWNEHDLEGVLNLLHEEIVFENWNGFTMNGKNLLKRSWTYWFNHHGNFSFTEEDLFFDSEKQKMLFMWKLEWPSQLKDSKGKREIRRGVDVLHFQDGKIRHKYSYSKTTLEIEGNRIYLE